MQNELYTTQFFLTTQQPAA